MSKNITWSNVADKASDLGIGSGASFYLSFEEGETIIRVLTQPVHYAQHFLGKGIKPVKCEDDNCPHCEEGAKPSHKFMCYVYNQGLKQLQLAELPWSVVKGVNALASSSQYPFGEGELPPYDLIVNKEGAGKETRYAVLAGRNEDGLPDTVAGDLEKLDSIKEQLAKKFDSNPNATEDDKKKA